MKRLAVAIVAAFAASIAASPVSAHADPDTPIETAATVTAMVAADVTEHPAYATNCTWTKRVSSAVGTCYNWSGSGNYKFQVAALMFDGCRRYVWYYGNVGWPYIRGKTTSGKWSYVYAPPGGWTITYVKVVIWKP